MDVSNLPSPATTRPGLPQSYSSTGSSAGRPALRNTTSSASLRSTTSTGSRARSPAPPPLPSPSLSQNVSRGTPTTNVTPGTRPSFRPSTSQTSTPTFRRAASGGRTSPVKETPTARIRASAVTQNAFSARSPQVNGGGSGSSAKAGEVDAYSTPGQGIFKRPSDVEPKLRARVTPNHTALSTSPDRYPPLLSPDTALDQAPSWRTQNQTYPSPLLPDSSTYGERSKPSPTAMASPSFAQHALVSQIPMHPTASAPGSPHHPSTPLSLQRSASIKSSARRMLPYNPMVQAPHIPATPLSPEMRTVDLPTMTPTRTRSREDSSRRPSLLGSVISGDDGGPLLRFDEPEQRNDETVVDSTRSHDKLVEGEPQDISEIDILLDTEDDVAEARVNRKVCQAVFANLDLVTNNRLPIWKSQMLVS